MLTVIAHRSYVIEDDIHSLSPHVDRTPLSQSSLTHIISGFLIQDRNVY